MISGAMIAEIAALAGDPARANILTALLDGRAMTATELSFAARVTPQTASAHLAKLVEAGLITVMQQGRHRYFRLGSPKVAQMLESIVSVAVDNRPRFRPLSRQAAELREARVCYDHLAGVLGVRIAEAMTRHGYLVLEDEGGQVTEAGQRFLWELGVDVQVAGKGGGIYAVPASTGPSGGRISAAPSALRWPSAGLRSDGSPGPRTAAP